MKIVIMMQISPQPSKAAIKTNKYMIITTYNVNYNINTCRIYK